MNWVGVREEDAVAKTEPKGSLGWVEYRERGESKWLKSNATTAGLVDHNKQGRYYHLRKGAEL
jgi:hypothetical protein